MRFNAVDGLRDTPDVFGRGAATSADDVHTVDLDELDDVLDGLDDLFSGLDDILNDLDNALQQNEGVIIPRTRIEPLQ